MPDFEFISFFCGSGSGTYGMIQAGGRCLLAIDIDPIARQSHERNIPEAPVIPLDMRGWETDQFRLLAGGIGIDPKNWDGCILWTAPCQDFAPCRSRKTGERNELTFMLVEAARAYPRATFIVEQVRNCLSKSTEFAEKMEMLQMDLRGIGRNTPTDWNGYVYGAWQFGLAQKRQRLIIPIPPAGRTTPEPVRTPFPPGRDGMREAVSAGLTLRAAIGPESGFQDPDPNGRILTVEERKLYQYILPGEDMASTAKRLGSTSPEGKIFHDLIAAWKNNKLYREAWDGLCRTICSIRAYSPKRLALVHPSEFRNLTVGECRELQGFPREWVLSGDVWDRYVQVADAVPNQMIAGVVPGYLGTIRGESRHARTVIERSPVLSK